MVYFNSHAHVERDDISFDVTTAHTISTHTLTWSVTFHTFQRGIGTCNFNSHAHVERDVVENDGLDRDKISTHTLTWSVTFTWENLPDTIDISTHTLTWSVTEMFSYFVNKFGISTHTLTWSVTYGILREFTPISFQLTRSRGA